MASKVSLSLPQMFHQIAEYAIDNPEGMYSRDFRTRLHLNPAVFHHKLYLSRPALEGRLRDALEHGPWLVCVLGHAGAGKTSLISRILLERTEAGLSLVFRCDFRWIPDLAAEGSSESGANSSAEMAEFLSRLLMTKLKTYILANGINWDALVVEALRQPPDASADDALVRNAQADLDSLYQRDSRGTNIREPQDYNSWLKDRVEALDVRVLSVFDAVRKGLTPGLLLQALARLTGTVCPAILVFDNVDSIPRYSQRAALLSFLRNAEASLRACARIILCARPESFEDVDAGEANGCEVVNLDEVTFASPSTAEMPFRQTERAPDWHGQQARFECVVLERRIQYLEEQLRHVSGSEQEREAATAMKRRCRSLCNKLLFQETLARLTNFDVRAMLTAMAGFIDYLSTSSDQELARIEARLSGAKPLHNRLYHRFQEEWDYRIEAHFATWMVGEQARREAILSDSHIYNLAAWLTAWWKQDKSALECLAPHLILATIYTSSAPARRHAEIGDVLGRCENIGLRASLTRGVLLSMCSEESSRRLVEMTQGAGFSRPQERLRETDCVNITARGRLFLEVISLQFHYLLALMNQQKIALRADEQARSYSTLRGLKSWQVGDLLLFIADIGQMELTMLCDVEQGQGGRDWLAYFQKSFCIPAARGDAAPDAQGDFLAPNMLASCHAYLEKLHRSEIFGRTVSSEMLQEYALMYKRFENLMDRLDHNKTLNLVECSLRTHINEHVFHTPTRPGSIQART